MKIKGKIVGTNQLKEIRIENGLIQSIENVTPVSPSGPPDAQSSWIAPAFFDIQVNGFAGIDFNSDRVRPEDLEEVILKLGQKGVVLLFPTIITHSFDHMSASIRNIAAACRDSRISRAVPGLHIEGPYISPEEGARGAHPREHIRLPDWEEFQRLQECAEGIVSLLTMAPEIEGAIPFMEKLVDSGVTVAIGHTSAKAEHIQTALKAGARVSTHLGNGSHAFLPRHHNYIWEQLAADQLWASFIVDGHHLPASVVKCMIRAKGISRSILTSDAVAAAGMPPGKYRLGDSEVVVSPEHRVERADLVGTGYLAGSALDLLRGVQNVVRFADVSLQEAIQMASFNPARMLGISDRIGTIEPGKEANLILFEWDHETKSLDLKCTIHGGEMVYKQ